ncbi:hypothetical protein L0V05_12400 [Tabrizicola sp. J26]|uniref:hypothetical protein n=1 Tax=Alitabrizicola rongguiensis TaxID=2909234 RepID=UPI001F42630B|nr:hypothetical protein [Tabrizicola rongguiensis]MCF1709615.1 hypothetical protein [Tabrizicola rongguiensis]
MLRGLSQKPRWPLEAPNYFHCAPKTGSTTLYYILSKHRDFCAARGKEPNFYYDDEYYSRGEGYFWKDRFSHYKGEKIAGDFSTSYIYSPSYSSGDEYKKCIGRIFKTRTPRHTYFSTCIRHPLMWHWSHYLHRVRNVDGFRALPPATGSFEAYLEERQSSGKLVTFEDQVRFLKRTFWGPIARRNLLILIYERDVGPDLSIAYSKICNLLSIDPANFEPIRGITSSERIESQEIVTEWRGPGTLADIRANRAYLPAVYRVDSDGVSQKGDSFSRGDIIIERDPRHISVIRNLDVATKRRYLGHYESMTTSLTIDEVVELNARFFRNATSELSRLLGGSIVEWEEGRLNPPKIEKVQPSYL